MAYIKEYPMPEDPKYSLDDMITDLVEPDGMFANYTLPDIKEDTMRYIEKLIDKLRDGRNYDIWKV